jgi:hypothetical protein
MRWRERPHELEEVREVLCELLAIVGFDRKRERFENRAVPENHELAVAVLEREFRRGFPSVALGSKLCEMPLLESRVNTIDDFVDSFHWALLGWLKLLKFDEILKRQTFQPREEITT